MTTLASGLQRSLVAMVAPRAGESRVVERRSGAVDADTAAATFVAAIAAGKTQSCGWDPREVWLERIQRPRQRRQGE